MLIKRKTFAMLGILAIFLFLTIGLVTAMMYARTTEKDESVYVGCTDDCKKLNISNGDKCGADGRRCVSGTINGRDCACSFICNNGTVKDATDCGSDMCNARNNECHLGMKVDLIIVR